MITTTLSMEGMSIHHIDTLYHLKRFRNSANANGHIQPVYAKNFLQSNPGMDVCDTDATDDLLWVTQSDKHVCRFAISDCISASPALSIRLKDQRISTMWIVECTWYNEYSYSLHLHFLSNISKIWKFSIDCGSKRRFDNQLSDWQLLHCRKALLGHFKLCFNHRQASWRPQHH